MSELLVIILRFFIAIKDVFYLAALVVLVWLFMKERKDMLNRIMSRDYQQYEYYNKMYGGEVEELKKQRDEMRKESLVTEEEKEIKDIMDMEYKKEKDFIGKTDEDWEEEEIDLEELRKRIEK